MNISILPWIERTKFDNNARSYNEKECYTQTLEKNVSSAWQKGYILTLQMMKLRHRNDMTDNVTWEQEQNEDLSPCPGLCSEPLQYRTPTILML